MQDYKKAQMTNAAIVVGISAIGLSIIFGTAQAATCEASGLSLKTAIAAKYRIPANDIGICGIKNTKPRTDGYADLTVQFAEGGELFCTRYPQETNVAVKVTCHE